MGRINERGKDMEKDYTHVIWDFNGTLYDDVEAGIRSANRLLCAHGLREFLSVEEYRRTFGFPIIDYYRRMGFDFEKTPYDTLAKEWVPYYMEASKEATVYPDAVPLLDLFFKKGLTQILLSATELDMLTGQLNRLGIYGEFREVIGLDNIHARSKKAQALAWKERNPHARPLFIGDTLHDADVAAAVGGDCVLFCGGHQSRDRLAVTGYPVISDIREIVNYL